MGYGDDIMATGMARGAATRHKKVAFGDGTKIIWGPWSEEMFRYNPNIAWPGNENDRNVEWVSHYKGHRLYNHLDEERNRWVWHYDFSVTPGEFYFNQAEQQFANSVGSHFIVIEPNVPWQKSVAPNKDWGFKRYQALADMLLRDDYDVVQFSYGRDKLHHVRFINAPTFRLALAALAKASYVVTPEGGLHHGAAAVRRQAAVLFGGFIPPQVTGYAIHTNFTGGVEACGSIQTCLHCRRAMNSIEVEQVYLAVKGHMLEADAGSIRKEETS